MNEPLNKSPFRKLGKSLKDLRQRANESLAEASGAVEIDVRELAGFELGKARPSEDVLLLLISHFGAKDDEAIKLWEMAGYGMDKIPASHMANSDTKATSAVDTNRVLYTDIVDVMVNNYGVVMSFMQGGPKDIVHPVARIGMSREHAKSVLKILEVTLSQTESRLPNKIQRTDNDRAKN
ncbi:helix-turn-helix domain-containing protein [Candidatus Saccharibacteria bacterium]|nr:helix-turn-helix domain-containing protein [Candidatus Saccharibacteria bacterium]